MRVRDIEDTFAQERRARRTERVRPTHGLPNPVCIVTLVGAGGCPPNTQTRSRASCWTRSVASCTGSRWASQKVVASARFGWCISASASIVSHNNGGDGGVPIGCSIWVAIPPTGHIYCGSIPLATLAAQTRQPRVWVSSPNVANGEGGCVAAKVWPGNGFAAQTWQPWGVSSPNPTALSCC